MTREVDVLVIGAGPAGLAAATEAANAGRSVVLLDEQPAPGGQIYRAVERASPALLKILGEDYAAGRALVDEFRASAAEYLPGASVWNIGTDRLVDYSQGGQIANLRAASIVCAAGALERPCPIPGWTLPGVTTVGGLQILLKTSGVVEEEVVLAGAGPLLWLLAGQLVAAGAPPKAVVETVPKGRQTAALSKLPGALRAAGYLRKGLALTTAVRRAGVPVYSHAEALEVEGELAVSGLRFRADGSEHRLACTALGLHQGLIPNQQITRLLRCEHAWDSAQHCFRPVLDDGFQTSFPGLYVVGDAGGISGAKAAALQGRILGIQLATAGSGAGRQAERRLGSLKAELGRDLAIRPFLEALYAPDPKLLAPADSTIVCRCEEVTAGRVREAVRLGAPGPNQVKSLIRTGMGSCQGRVCGVAVASIIAAEQGAPPDQADYYRIRPPLKPLPLTELAAYPATGPDDEEREP
ncbi:MAG: FAD-dependent oxidoreductase [Acetobacteraceae bacterium]|nr:FAD-dependent oxidoreductase [Acetobacteraceae bacterium]